MVGVATGDVSPPVGTPLGGYPVEGRVSSGVHDRLQVVGVSVRDDIAGDHLVVLCFDGISVPSGLVTGVDDGVHVVVVASHTHAAPSLEAWDQGVMGAYSAGYQSDLVSTCRRVVTEAIGAERRGYLAAGSGRLAEPVGTNRRDGDGRRDETIRVIEARADDDSVLAVLALHGCHPTVLSADNTLVSGDLVWGLRERVAGSLPGVPVAYLPGGAGDQSTRHTRRGSTFEEAARLGGILGDAVLDARAMMVGLERSRVLQATFSLEPRPTPPLDVAERRWEQWVAEVDRRACDGSDASWLRQAEVELIGANHDLRRARVSLSLPTAIEVSVTRWHLGDRSIAFWPVEPTIDLALDLETADRTWLCGYASGYLGYLLEEQDCARGGYEVAASPFECSAASRFVEATRSLARQTDS